MGDLVASRTDITICDTFGGESKPRKSKEENESNSPNADQIQEIDQRVQNGPETKIETNQTLSTQILEYMFTLYTMGYQVIL